MDLSHSREYMLHDLKAGFVTAIVALPLAIGFAFASGVPPINGIYTAIIAGILGSAFGGSRFSITGPTGAMAVVILAAVNAHGFDGLLLAGIVAGLIQLIFGLARIGSIIKFMPFPIVSGFTAGIGIIIFTGQIANALGLEIQAKEHVWQIFGGLWNQAGSANGAAMVLAGLTLAILVFLPRILARHHMLLPPSIIALVLTTGAVMVFSLDVPVVGEIPSGLPSFHLPNFNLQLLRDVLPIGFTIALLGSIESLLCAVVCDGMTGTKHNADKELRGQGTVNVVLPFFGGIPATAAVARSAVNIREGARTKFAGIIHAVIILLIVLLFAPLAKHIPKAFLAGILMFVSAKMINFHEMKTIYHISGAEFLVLLATLGFTVFTDLVFAVQMGILFAVFLVFLKLTSIADIKYIEEHNDRIYEFNSILEKNNVLKSAVAVYTVHGPFFFGAMNVFERKVDEHMAMKKPVVVLRMKHVPFIDSTAVVRLNDFIAARHKQKKKVLISGLQPGVKEALMSNPAFRKLMPDDHIFERTSDALASVEHRITGWILEDGKFDV